VLIPVDGVVRRPLPVVDEMPGVTAGEELKSDMKELNI
jgi:hypothetical protein